jgi:hypothetical protein
MTIYYFTKVVRLITIVVGDLFEVEPRELMVLTCGTEEFIMYLYTKAAAIE